jgi:hypothetical protein
MRLAAGSLLALLSSLLSTTPARGADEVVVYPARKILSMEPARPEATAVAVEGERIAALGTLDEVKAAVAGRAFRVDERFAERVLVPGFIDNHLHPALAAVLLPGEFIAPEEWRLPGRTVPAVPILATVFEGRVYPVAR